MHYFDIQIDIHLSLYMSLKPIRVIYDVLGIIFVCLKGQIGIELICVQR